MDAQSSSAGVPAGSAGATTLQSARQTEPRAHTRRAAPRRPAGAACARRRPRRPAPARPRRRAPCRWARARRAARSRPARPRARPPRRPRPRRARAAAAAAPAASPGTRRQRGPRSSRGRPPNRTSLSAPSPCGARRRPCFGSGRASGTWLGATAWWMGAWWMLRQRRHDERRQQTGGRGAHRPSSGTNASGRLRTRPLRRPTASPGAACVAPRARSSASRQRRRPRAGRSPASAGAGRATPRARSRSHRRAAAVSSHCGGGACCQHAERRGRMRTCMSTCCTALVFQACRPASNHHLLLVLPRARILACSLSRTLYHTHESAQLHGGPQRAGTCGGAHKPACRHGGSCASACAVGGTRGGAPSGGGTGTKRTWRPARQAVCANTWVCARCPTQRFGRHRRVPQLRASQARHSTHAVLPQRPAGIVRLAQRARRRCRHNLPPGTPAWNLLRASFDVQAPGTGGPGTQVAAPAPAAPRLRRSTSQPAARQTCPPPTALRTARPRAPPSAARRRRRCGARAPTRAPTRTAHRRSCAAAEL